MAEAALADAGRAHDTHREAVPLKGAPQGGVERGHLIVATNEARKSVPRGGLEPSPCRTGADHLEPLDGDRKSTRLNSSHGYISYAVFCLKKKKKDTNTEHSHNSCAYT